MTTRSLSSPKSVVRSQVAPSFSNMWPDARRRSTARSTAPDSCSESSWK
ncbi:Uncharacterised protein [Mycobacteroides abscessus]|nr:Uncharacterised protein [Mycobacteroides abscessus]